MPNETAYVETCASIAIMFFCKSMMKIENKTVYADIIEKEMYNAMLSGLSLDGKAFFYENPLEINLRSHSRNLSLLRSERLPITQRKEVFDCSCCPPNINRVLATINEYIYAVDGDVLYVNQFMSSEARFEDIKVIQATQYPVDGKIEMTFENAKSVMIRIPSWCNEYTVDCEYSVEDNYIKLINPSSVKIEFVMKPMLMMSKTDVQNNIGKVAVQYGPVVYCGESVDNIENLHSLYINRNHDAKVNYNEKYGMNEISVKGFISKSSESLYCEFEEDLEETEIKLIPYSCFANRGESNMLVWFKIK